MRVRLVETNTLRPSEQRAIRRLLERAFAGGFTDDDWTHTVGGTHVLVEKDDSLVAHAAVVQRRIDVGGVVLPCGYVEGVATEPAARGSGAATLAMRHVGELIDDRFALGVLSTGAWPFYERLGWERWRGPTAVRHRDGSVEPTPEDDDGVMIMRTPVTRSRLPVLDLTTTIVCDDRSGDVW